MLVKLKQDQREHRLSWREARWADKKESFGLKKILELRRRKTGMERGNGGGTES